MAVYLEDTRLWHGRQTRVVGNASERMDSVIGEDSDKTLLTSLESVEEVDYTGVASGIRLSGVSGYSDDPLTALAEWVAEFEAYLDGAQGEGYTFKDEGRGREMNTVLEQAGWTRKEGEKYQVEWDLSGVWARGAMPDHAVDVDSVNPTSGPPKIAGEPIKGITAVRHQKRTQLQQYPIAYADPGDNETLAQSGAVRKITIRGDSTGSESVRNSFDDKMLGEIGEDNIVKWESAFPGRTKEVMVTDYDSIREAGRTRIGEYMIELTEGVADPGAGGLVAG